jgi:hypothetical protein
MGKNLESGFFSFPLNAYCLYCGRNGLIKVEKECNDYLLHCMLPYPDGADFMMNELHEQCGEGISV